MPETIDLRPFQSGPYLGDSNFPSEAQRRVAERIDFNFREHGYLFLTNIGFQANDISQALSNASELFSLSDEYKQNRLYRFSAETNLGYTPIYFENLNHFRPPDVRECFNLRPPSENPEHVSALSSSFVSWADQFWNNLQNASRLFLIAISVALNVSPDFLLSACFNDDGNGSISNSMTAKTVVRLAHYPPCDFIPDDQKDKGHPGKSKVSLRCAEHTDFGIFTLLFTDSSGFQVFNREEQKWITVQPVPEKPTAIVDAGALLQRLTNGRWHAVLHRVIVENQEQADESRLSVIVFVNPGDDVVFNPIIQNGDDKKYETVTAKEYLQSRIEHSIGKEVDGVDALVLT